MKKKILALITSIFMSSMLLMSCGETKDQIDKQTKEDLVETVENEKEEVKESETKSLEKADENEKIIVRDMFGRDVEIDGIPETVICTCKGSLRLYSYIADTSKIAGVPLQEKKNLGRIPYSYAHPEYRELPTFGSGGKGCDGEDDLEKILEIHPDLIFAMDRDKANTEKMQEKLGIPVVTLSYGPDVVFGDNLYASLRLIGKVMGEEDRAEEVVKYMEDCKKDLNERTADIKDDEKFSAYAGGLAWRGSHGIESTREIYPLFEAINAKNVVTGTGKEGSVMIDKEKLLEWNPDVIFIDLASLQNIKEDYQKNPEYYNSLSAFKNEKVYAQLPYVWSMVNPGTAMGDAYYMGKVLYPEQFKDVDPEEKIDEIYETLLGKAVYKDMVEAVGPFRSIGSKELSN